MKNDFVVNITKLTKAVSSQVFGLPLILGTSKDMPYTLYDSISGIAEDYGISGGEYKIASRIFGQSPAPQQIAVFSIDTAGGNAADLLLEAVNEIIETDNDWYFLTCTDNSDDVIKALAGWADTQIKMYFATTQNLLLAPLMENENTVLMYHEDPEAYVAEGLTAIAATNEPGSLTFKFKTVNGVSGSGIRSTDLSALHDSGGFSYTRKMGNLETTEGITTSGELRINKEETI